MTKAKNYQFIFREKKRSKHLLVLLHGTGGNERDLIPIAEVIAPQASLLGIRGDVDENGSLRFFKRTGMGRYDMDDLNQRARALASFIEAFASEQGYAMSQVILLGFSNGTNIALHMILQDLIRVGGGLFFAPLYPLESKKDLDLSGFPAFVSMGKADPIVAKTESEHVLELLTVANATVTPYWVEGHEITSGLIHSARDWLKDLKE